MINVTNKISKFNSLKCHFLDSRKCYTCVRLILTLGAIDWIFRRTLCYDLFKHLDCICTWRPLCEDNVSRQVSSRSGACQNKPPKILATWMKIAIHRSEIRMHRKEDDGTRVHVGTFVWCTDIASGVTNGLEHPACEIKDWKRKKKKHRVKKEKRKGNSRKGKKRRKGRKEVGKWKRIKIEKIKERKGKNEEN